MKARRVIARAWDAFDRAQGKISPSALLGLISLLLLFGLVLTAVQIGLDWRDFLGRNLCLSSKCTNEFLSMLESKASPLFIASKLSIFIAAIIAPYIALKNYISTSSAQAFGNSIAHIGFFERFMRSEIEKRDRISPTSVDVYSIYRLMFPRDGESGLSLEFRKKAEEVRSVILTSNELCVGNAKSYKFEAHRKKMIDALRQVGISASSTPRIDFLETEDQILDFLEMLLWVFAKEAKGSFFPHREYR